MFFFCISGNHLALDSNLQMGRRCDHTSLISGDDEWGDGRATDVTDRAMSDDWAIVSDIARYDNAVERCQNALIGCHSKWVLRLLQLCSLVMWLTLSCNFRTYRFFSSRR